MTLLDENAHNRSFAYAPTPSAYLPAELVFQTHQPAFTPSPPSQGHLVIRYFNSSHVLDFSLFSLLHFLLLHTTRVEIISSHNPNLKFIHRPQLPKIHCMSSREGDLPPQPPTNPGHVSVNPEGDIPAPNTSPRRDRLVKSSSIFIPFDSRPKEPGEIDVKVRKLV